MQYGSPADDADAPRNEAPDETRGEGSDVAPDRNDCMDNLKVQVRQTSIYGLAVFAIEPIQKDQLIAIFDGPVYVALSALELPDESPLFVRDHAIQIAPDRWQDSSGVARLLSHSCNPNCGIRGYTNIVALRQIDAGEEVTWDYAMTENSNWIVQPCLCGSANCRGRIGPWRELPIHIRERLCDYTSQWLSPRPSTAS